MLKTQQEIRTQFWLDNPQLQRRAGRQNEQPTDTRCAFVDYVDMLSKSGTIFEALAQRVTL